MFVYENREDNPAVLPRKNLRCIPHLHKEIEMVYVLRGTTVAYADSKRYELHEGDLFFCFPNKVHYYEDYLLRDSILLIFSPDMIPDFKQLLVTQSPREAVALKKDMPSQTDGLFRQILTSFYDESPYRQEIFRGYMSALLGLVLPAFSFDEDHAGNNDVLPDVMSYCLKHYCDPITLDGMAADLHISKYYISRLFGKKIKIGFNEYVNMLRINEAKSRLVKTDDSVTQISIDVGYNTIRSFNRAFLANTGCQPRVYRTEMRKLIKQKNNISDS